MRVLVVTNLTPDERAPNRGNYVREMPGWRVELLHRHPHTLRTTTPTGHTYVSRAGPLARGLPDTPG